MDSRDRRRFQDAGLGGAGFVGAGADEEEVSAVLNDLALGVAEFEGEGKDAAIAFAGQPFFGDGEAADDAIAGEEGFAEVPLPGEGGDGSEGLFGSVLEAVEEDETEETVGDAAGEAEGAGEFVVHVKGEEVAGESGELDDVGVGDGEAGGFDGEAGFDVFVEKQLAHWGMIPLVRGHGKPAGRPAGRRGARVTIE